MSFDAFLLALTQLADPYVLILLVAGVFLGTIIGILPGLGAPIAITIALPFTLYMDAAPAFVLLLAIYSAAMYGGSVSAITLGIPGTGAAAAAVEDGHRMFKTGRGGEALGLSLTASVIGGLFSTIALALLAPVLATIAIKFGPREFFAISVFGIIVVVRVAGRSMVKGLAAAGMGVWLTTWGIDELNGAERYMFGSYNLYEGLPFVSVLVGIFAISELLLNAQRKMPPPVFDKGSLSAKLPGLKILTDLKATIMRSSIVGTVIGILPGEGAAIGAFFGYAEAKRKSKHPEKFGTGIPEGVVAPEAANNATVGGALIPTLTLGVPGSPAAAILLGALLIQGLAPGPRLFAEAPDLMYAIFIGLFFINIVLLFIGMLTIRMAARIVVIPLHVIVPTVMLLCFVGVYSVKNDLFGVAVLIAIGVFGFVLRKLNYAIAPFTIGFVLGPILERSFRQSYLVGDGTVIGFFESWIAVIIYLALFFSIAGGPIYAVIRKKMANVEDQ
ncbi:MAG: tripartite tricarboxylate transporter permease [Pseudomonadota bacterium]